MCAEKTVPLPDSTRTGSSATSAVVRGWRCERAGRARQRGRPRVGGLLEGAVQPSPAERTAKERQGRRGQGSAPAPPRRDLPSGSLPKQQASHPPLENFCFKLITPVTEDAT